MGNLDGLRANYNVVAPAIAYMREHFSSQAGQYVGHVEAPDFDRALDGLLDAVRLLLASEYGAADHVLKTWPQFFSAILAGEKTFEIRSTADRTFEVGQLLRLVEFDPDAEALTGRSVDRVVTFVLEGVLANGFGLAPGHAALGLREVRS